MSLCTIFSSAGGGGGGGGEGGGHFQKMPHPHIPPPPKTLYLSSWRVGEVESKVVAPPLTQMRFIGSGLGLKMSSLGV